jgi:hypothetical protein
MVRAVSKVSKYEYDSRHTPIPTGTRPVSSPSDLKTIGLKATLPRLRILW